MNLSLTGILPRAGTRAGALATGTLLAASLLALTGCGTLTAEHGLKESLPEGQTFARALAREYQARADSEAYQDGNWADAVLFVRRMERAAAGEIVPPLHPDDFHVADHRTDLLTAHAALVRALLEENGIAARPLACAKAQRYFDGWVEQASDNKWGKGGSYFGGAGGEIQPGWVMAERAAFNEYLEACKAPPPPPPPPPAPEPEPEMAEEEPMEEETMEVMVEEPEPITGDYVVYFAFDKSDLTPEARSVIREVVSLIYGADTYTVSIVGHTDTVGTNDYNIALGWRRANAVRDFLVSEGVPATSLSTDSRGESEPAIPSGDQIREARNRRAVITVEGGQ